MSGSRQNDVRAAHVPDDSDSSSTDLGTQQCACQGHQFEGTKTLKTQQNVQCWTLKEIDLSGKALNLASPIGVSCRPQAVAGCQCAQAGVTALALAMNPESWRRNPAAYAAAQR